GATGPRGGGLCRGPPPERRARAPPPGWPRRTGRRPSASPPCLRRPGPPPAAGPSRRPGRQPAPCTPRRAGWARGTSTDNRIARLPPAPRAARMEPFSARTERRRGSGRGIHSAMTPGPTKSSAWWRFPAALMALIAIPVAAGVHRLVVLAVGAPVTHDDVRFFAAPIPVVVHIIGASLFCVLGALQFAPAFRR